MEGWNTIKMALSEFEKKRIDRIFTEYCKKRVPDSVKHQVRIEYQIRGNEVKLFEVRRQWQDLSMWTRIKIARFKKDPKTNLWELYCVDRNDRWRPFDLCPDEKDIAKLLAEVEEDSTAIFWGWGWEKTGSRSIPWKDWPRPPDRICRFFKKKLCERPFQIIR